MQLPGIIHLLASLVALFSGTLVLAREKGTPAHRAWGYVYTLSMGILLLTAFSIYRLFGGFGPFHLAALLSTLTLLGGLLPAWLRYRHWQRTHLAFMYWSVIGLYAAFVSEVLTRLPRTPFFGMVALGSGIVIAAGGWFWYKYKHRWFARY